MDIWRSFKDRLQGKAPPGTKRNPEWRKVRKKFIAKNPRCMVCDGVKKLEVHHVLPFHMFPDQELNESNLMTLCDGDPKLGIQSCHQLFGHLGRWTSFNPNAVEDAKIWRKRLEKESR